MADRNVTPALAGHLIEAAATEVEVSSTAPDAAPTPSTDGIDCSGYTHVLVGLRLAGSAVDYGAEFWVQFGSVWFQLTDSSGAVIDLDGQTAALALNLFIGAADRFYVRFDGIGAGAGASSAKKTTRLYNMMAP